MLRLWLHVESEEPAWGAWKGLALAGADPPPPARAVRRSWPRHARSSPSVQRAGGRPRRGRRPSLRMLRACAAHHAQHRPHRRRGDRLRSRLHPAVFTRSAMASVWTSQLPDEHHGSVSYDEPLPTGVPTLAGIVSAAGITTAGFVGNNMAGHRVRARPRVLGVLPPELPRRGPPRVPPRLARPESRNGASWPTSITASRTIPFDPRPPFDTMFGPDAPLPASVKTDSGVARPRERRLPSPHPRRRSITSSGSTTATWPRWTTRSASSASTWKRWGLGPARC